MRWLLNWLHCRGWYGRSREEEERVKAQFEERHERVKRDVDRLKQLREARRA